MNTHGKLEIENTLTYRAWNSIAYKLLYIYASTRLQGMDPTKFTVRDYSSNVNTHTGKGCPGGVMFGRTL